MCFQFFVLDSGVDFMVDGVKKSNSLSILCIGFFHGKPLIIQKADFLTFNSLYWIRLSWCHARTVSGVLYFQFFVLDSVFYCGLYHLFDLLSILCIGFYQTLEVWELSFAFTFNSLYWILIIAW